MSVFPLITRPVDEKIPEGEVLYRAYLIPETSQLQALGMTAELAEKVTYRILDGGETPVNVGRPIAYDLLQIFQDSGIAPSPFVTQKLAQYEFRLVRCACAFRSHDGTPHPFVWGELKVTLTNLAGGEAPIIFDIAPDEVLTEVEVSREVGLSPSAEFMNVKVSVERMYARVVRFTELRAVISAFGKLDSVGGWQYDVTPSRPDVRGNREGVLVVMSPKGADVRVAVDARARVRENFLTKVLSRSGRWTDEDFINLKSLDVPLTRAVPMTEQQLQSRFTTGFADLVLGKGSMVAGENAVVLPASS